MRRIIPKVKVGEDWQEGSVKVRADGIKVEDSVQVRADEKVDVAEDSVQVRAPKNKGPKRYYGNGGRGGSGGRLKRAGKKVEDSVQVRADEKVDVAEDSVQVRSLNFKGAKGYYGRKKGGK